MLFILDRHAAIISSVHTVGGVFPLLDMTLVNSKMYQEFMEGKQGKSEPDSVFSNGIVIACALVLCYVEQGGWVFDQVALQKYLIGACQDFINGGLMDKPGKGKDFYHTCYTLSGTVLFCVS